MATAGKPQGPHKAPRIAKRMGNPNPPTSRALVQTTSFSTYQNRAQPVKDPSIIGGLPTSAPYPDMPHGTDKKPEMTVVGAPGTAFFGGIIQTDEYNPDFYWRDGTAIYEQMLRSDAQINAIRSMIELPIRRATYRVEPFSADPKDQEVASFVESCLFHDMAYTSATGHTVKQKWDDLLRHALLMLWHGFSGFELCFKIEDGWVKWAQWVPLLPRTFWRWWVDEGNDLVGIQQWTFKDYNYEFRNIPVEKLVILTHRMEGQNYEGISLLRTAYKHWWYKVQYEKINAIGVERNAVTPPIVYLPENFTANDQAAAMAIAQNLRVNELMGVTVPGTWRIEYPKNMEKYAETTQGSIDYEDVQIARNVLCQMINLGSTETGSYSQDRSQKLTFLASIQTYADYICECITHAAQQLVDYNYADLEGYPSVKCSKIVAQDIEIVSDAIKNFTQGKVPIMHYSPELEEALGDLLGLPVNPQTQSPITTTDPTQPTNPDQPDTPQEGNDQQPQQTTATPATATKAEDGQGGIITNSEVRRLAETVLALDAVERGMTFYNPYHDARGRFTGPGGSGGGGAGVRQVARGQGRTVRQGTRRLSNPNHRPGGEPDGGQFAPRGAGGGGSGTHEEALVHEAHARIASARQRAHDLTRQAEGERTQSRELQNKADALDAQAQGRYDAEQAASRASGQMVYHHTGPLETVAETQQTTNGITYLSPVHGSISIEPHTISTGSGSGLNIYHDGTYSMYASHHGRSGDATNENLTPNRTLTPEEATAKLHELGIANEFHGTPGGAAGSHYIRNGEVTPEAQHQEDHAEDGYHRADAIEREMGGTTIRDGGTTYAITPHNQGGYEVRRNDEVVARGISRQQVNDYLGGAARLSDYQPFPGVAGHADHLATISQPGDLGGTLPFQRNAPQITHPDSAGLRMEARSHETIANTLEQHARTAQEDAGNVYGTLEGLRSGAISHVQTTEEDMNGARAVFHNEHLSARDLEQMVGAEAGSRVTITSDGQTVDLHMKNDATDGSMSMSIERNDQGKLIAHVGYATSGNKTEVQVLPDGTTREILATRSAASGKVIINAMEAMRRGGIDRLNTTAGGTAIHGLNTRDMNGYRTWPRLGFKGKIDESLRGAIRQRFGSGITRVEQMMETRERRTWWNENGGGGHVHFDFHDPYCLGVLARLHAAAHHGESPSA